MFGETILGCLASGTTNNGHGRNQRTGPRSRSQLRELERSAVGRASACVGVPRRRGKRYEDSSAPTAGGFGASTDTASGELPISSSKVERSAVEPTAQLERSAVSRERYKVVTSGDRETRRLDAERRRARWACRISALRRPRLLQEVRKTKIKSSPWSEAELGPDGGNGRRKRRRRTPRRRRHRSIARAHHTQGIRPRSQVRVRGPSRP